MIPKGYRATKRQIELHRIAEYKRATGTTKNKPIYEDRRSGIHKPQFYDWRKGTLPATSQTAINFERFLSEKLPPRTPD